MGYQRRATFLAVRELAFGSISGTYAAVGTAITGYPRIITIVNGTDKDLYFSIDGTTNQFRIRSGSDRQLQLATNQIAEQGFFPINNFTVYVKQTATGAATSGFVAVEVVEGADSKP